MLTKMRDALMAPAGWASDEFSLPEKLVMIGVFAAFPLLVMGAYA